MSEPKTSALVADYYAYLEEQKIIASTLSLLSWDQETKMPVEATSFRAQQMGYFSTLLHKKGTDKKFITLVNTLLDNKDKLDLTTQRSIEVTHKEIKKATLLPSEFVDTFSKTRAQAHRAWLEAKQKDDFAVFLPYLRKIVELNKQYANYIDPNKPIYDVLLDDYEEGITTTELKTILEEVKGGVVSILKKVHHVKPKNPLLEIDFNEHVAEDLVTEIVQKIGFNFAKGAVGKVHHPFQTSISDTDQRINMSYYHKDILATITGAIHELGHGLYEQNIDSIYNKTSLRSGASLGVHESQSRLLENNIGRSFAFWSFALPLLKKYFPKAQDVSEKDVVDYLNAIHPSLIRIEADEVTYNLHIIIRFEVEQALLDSEMDLSYLPELWNGKYEELLQIRPPKISQGVLQDVHWSMGSIGYFPTYTLGNVLSAQLWDLMLEQNPDLLEKIKEGNFEEYFTWCNSTIWQYGSAFTPRQLIKKITGEYYNSTSFIDYLNKKYTKSLI